MAGFSCRCVDFFFESHARVFKDGVVGAEAVFAEQTAQRCHSLLVGSRDKTRCDSKRILASRTVLSASRARFIYGSRRQRLCRLFIDGIVQRYKRLKRSIGGNPSRQASGTVGSIKDQRTRVPASPFHERVNRRADNDRAPWQLSIFRGCRRSSTRRPVWRHDRRSAQLPVQQGRWPPTPGLAPFRR